MQEEAADESMEETRADSKGRKRAGSRFLQDEADASEGSDDESADEHASDADSNGDLKGFTVPDAEASESNHETDEEIEEPPARRRLQRYHTAMGELSAVDEAKLKNLMRRACRVARGRPRVLRELARWLDGEATTLEETAESEADTEREQPVDASGSERAEESGDESGGEADDERGEEDGALSLIPTTPAVAVDMRTWGELLPKALHDSFGPVVKLCEATPDACRPRDSTVKHAMAARDNQSSKIGRAGAELCVPADQLLLATLPDGRGGVCAAMWAVVESVQRDRRRGAAPHHKISV